MKRRLLSMFLALTLAFTMNTAALASGSETSASQKYVEAMGCGWNLGNSFNGFNSDAPHPVYPLVGVRWENCYQRGLDGAVQGSGRPGCSRRSLLHGKHPP